MKYVMMKKDTPVLVFEFDTEKKLVTQVHEYINKESLPFELYDSRYNPSIKELNRWVNNRAIPHTRKGLNQALRNMDVESSLDLMMLSYGLSLTDQYWIKPIYVELDWDKINYFENDFSDYIGTHLLGAVTAKIKKEMNGPCGSLGGNLPKKWAIDEDGTRCLIKSGVYNGYQEVYNELLATYMHEVLKVSPFVSYSVVSVNGYPCSKCNNFIDINSELVSGYHVVGSVPKKSDVNFYNHFIQLCEGNGLEHVREVMDYMLITDFLIANQDRHFTNFGIIRDSNTLEWKSLAPIFDSGNSLWYKTPTSLIVGNLDVECTSFRKSQDKQIELVTNFDVVDMSKIRTLPDVFFELLHPNDEISSHRKDRLCEGLRDRIVHFEKDILPKRKWVLGCQVDNLIKDASARCSSSIQNLTATCNLGKEETIL